MSDSSNPSFALGRGVVLAVVTWLVLGVWTAGFLLGRDPLAAVPGRPIPAERQQVREAVGGFPDFLVGVLTFDVGNSLVWAPGSPALGRVVAHLGRLIAAVVAAVAVAALVAWLLVRVARDGRRPRLVGTVGYLGAVPAVGWLAVWSVVANATPLPLVPKGPLWVVVTGVAVGLPLAAAAVRAAGRGGAGSGPRDGAVIDAWLWGSWLVGAAVTMDLAFGSTTVGYLLTLGLTNADLPLLAAAVLVLSLPLLVVSPVREVAWERTRADASPSADHGAGATATGTDGGTLPADAAEPTVDESDAPGLAAVLGEDRRVRGGLAAFGVLLVVGVGGALALSPPPEEATRGAVVPATLLARLGTVTLVAGLTTVVGAGVGVPLGVVGGASRTRGSLVRVVDVAANLPLVVLAVLTLGPGFPGRDVLDADLLVGVVAGLAVAALVLRTTERELARTDDWRVAAVPAAGVAATGGVVVAFLVAQLSVVGLALTPGGGVGIAWSAAKLVFEMVAPVALPALALLVVGERLRTAGVRGSGQ